MRDIGLDEMLDCIICTSFWVSLLVELFLYFVTGFGYFMWPLSGFAVSGISWLILETLSIMDTEVAE